MNRNLRVLIVDNSEFFCELLKIKLTGLGYNVVGTANDAYDARDKILSLQPDVMTLDVKLPKMDGISFLKKLIPQYPIPVIIVTALSLSKNDVLSMGGVGIVNKPQNKDDEENFFKELESKLDFARLLLKKSSNRKIIAIGASTGGTDAIEEVIKKLPPDTVPVVIVQHMPVGVFTKMFAQRLDKNSSLSVKEAEDMDRVSVGECLIAKAGYQMKVYRDNEGYYVRLISEEKVSGHIPSVDVLFESVANVAGNKAIGVLLTGMGADGAYGLKMMHDMGAFTVTQDEETCVVYGMPMEAVKLGASDKNLPIDEIAGEIMMRLQGDF